MPKRLISISNHEERRATPRYAVRRVQMQTWAHMHALEFDWAFLDVLGLDDAPSSALAIEYNVINSSYIQEYKAGIVLIQLHYNWSPDK